MAQDLLLANVSIKDQHQNKLGAGDYKAKVIHIYFVPPGPAEVKITINGNTPIPSQKQIFQIGFYNQGKVDIRGRKHGETEDKYIQLFNDNANTITIEDASGSNSIEQIRITPDGTNWTQLTLATNPSQIVISKIAGEGPGPDGTQLWTSAAWNNDKKRTLTGHEQKDPHDSKLMVAAGEGDFRKLVIDGNGKAFLTGARCRIFIAVNNYNAMMQLTYTHNETLDNLSLRLRSKRNEQDGFGGYGFIITRDKVEAKYQTQYRGDNIDLGSKELPDPLPDDSPVRIKWCVRDEGEKIQVKGWIDYGDGEFKPVYDELDDKFLPIARDKQSFLESSTAWIRINNQDKKDEGLPKDVQFNDVSISEIE
jgi:hypothetical protein